MSSWSKWIGAGLAAMIATAALAQTPQRPARPPAPPPANVVQAKTLVDNAVANADAGRFDRALTLVNEAMRLDPANVTALLLRAGIKVELRDCPGAIADFNAYEKTTMGDAVMGMNGDYTQRAWCHAELKNFTAAIADQTAHLDYTADVEAYENLARYQFIANKTDDALKTLRTATALDPKRAEAFLLLGDVQKARREYAEALKNYMTARELKPTDAGAPFSQAQALILLNRLPEAQTALRESLQLRPDYPEATSLLAGVQAELAKPAQASTSAPRPLAAVAPAPQRAAAPAAPAPQRSYAPIDPRSPFGRGVALYRDRDFQPALAQLLTAAQASPNDARVHAFLGATYDWLGMARESAAAFDTARRLDPDALEFLR